MRHCPVTGVVSLVSFALAGAGLAQTLPAPDPTPREAVSYDVAFYDAAAHDPAITTPERLLGFPGGQRAATHAEILECFETWSRESPRADLVRYATSYEGRDLFYLVISSPRNMANLEDIRAGLDRLADPRAARALESLTDSLPAVAWLAYSIHGDEMSGADGALIAAYHLLASTDPDSASLLEDCVIIIDPMMNPDGRDRFIQQIRQNDGRVPNTSVESITHGGYWPWGRTNHYLFDLNRDWIFGIHPETRGRIDAVKRWHPLMFIDCHEMGGLDTYLFSPSRQPVNPNLPERRLHWWDV
ncbi:MAG: hypothetical protein KDA21_07980, partial [Phycisphaerales bacterium]|nr:hypothetical protein [Phycisphaerales bacterium]